VKPATLKALECPGCRSGYRAVAQITDGERIVQGYLICNCRAAVIPVIEGFVLFTEPLLHEGLAEPALLAELAGRIFGSAQGLEALYEQKRSRGLVESYAAFQPFNESARAVEPLLSRLCAELREGDLVLDVWCRTGWSAEWLAGHLPAQHVVALWEGDSSVLGYRGFRHLLAAGQRAPNLDVIFLNVERGLPFRKDAFALLYGHDILHRKSLHPFGAECLRVTRKSGAVVFPHVHLSNSEPEPFFERGGTIRHGRDYRAWLDAISGAGARRAVVCSEKTLFQEEECANVVDEPDTTHYNALIAILPAAEPRADSRSASDRSRFILNPLFRVDLARATASFSDQSLGGGAADLMLRHPIYRDRLPGAPVSLEGSRLLALVLAAAGLESRTIVQCVTAVCGPGASDCADVNAAAAALRELVASELLRPAPVSRAAHRLQRYHSNQLAALDEAVWPIWLRRLTASETPMLSLPDGTCVTSPEVADFMLRVAAWLPTLEISPGEWMCASPAEHPLLWLAAMAAAMSGINVEIGARPSSGAHRHRLWLHDDELVVEEAPCPSLPLQRDAEQSLLGRLATAAASSNATPSRTDGKVSFLAGGHRIICRMQDLCRGALALQAQVVPQMFLLERSDPVKNLVRLVLALASAGRIL